MRVLLVEDTPRLAEAIAEILRKNGYGADAAYTGADGLDMASSGAYDVVLLDIMLPDMSGMDVLRELRATNDTVPVILLTARQGVGDRVAGLDAGETVESQVQWTSNMREDIDEPADRTCKLLDLVTQPGEVEDEPVEEPGKRDPDEKRSAEGGPVEKEAAGE